MKTLRTRLPLLLATIVALRALVPVGYMLSLPSGGSFAFALHLCPIQNPTLDLQQLAAIDGTETAHDGHAGLVKDDADPVMAVTVSPTCDAWLDSAAFAVATYTQPLNLEPQPVLPPADINTALVQLSPSYWIFPRAPPGLPV